MRRAAVVRLIRKSEFAANKLANVDQNPVREAILGPFHWHFRAYFIQLSKDNLAYLCNECVYASARDCNADTLVNTYRIGRRSSLMVFLMLLMF
jgi:hypothetical protein